MNELGFIAAIVAIIMMVGTGFFAPARKGLSRFLAAAGKQKERIGYYLERTSAVPLARVLFIFAFVLAIVLADVIRVITGSDTPQVNRFVASVIVTFGIVLLAFAVYYGFYMLQGRAKYREGPDGETLDHPIYNQNAAGHYLDKDDSILCYKPGGAPLDLDEVGRARRYYRTATGLWWDGLTDTAYTPTDTAFLTVTLSDKDRRVLHELSALPMLDETVDNRNKFGRVKILRVIQFVTVSTLLMGFALMVLAFTCGQPETYRINTQLYTVEWGTTHLIDLGALLLFLALGFVLAVIVPCLWAFRKGTKLVEFILSTGAGEALLATLQYRQDNLRTLFKGIDLVDEEGVSKKVLMSVITVILNFIFFYTAVRLWPHAYVATFVLSLMVLYGLWNFHYECHAGSADVLKGKRALSRTIRNNIPLLCVLVALSAKLDIVNKTFLLLLAQTSNANAETNAFLEGQRTIHFLTFWPGLGVVVFGGLATWLLLFFNGVLNDSNAGWLKRNVARYHGMLGLLSSVVAGTFLLLLALPLAGIKEYTPPKAVAYRLPHAPPAAPLIVSEIILDPSPNGLATTVSWADQSEDEIGFDVEREGVQTKNGPQVWYKVGTVPANTTSFTDKRVEPGTYYRYRIVAVNEAGRSQSLNSDWIGIPATPSPSKDNAADKADPTPGPAPKKPVVETKKTVEKESLVRVASNTKDLKGFDPLFLANYRDLNNGKDP